MWFSKVLNPEREERPMDVYCRHCREPWDNDTLHEAVADGLFPSYDKAAAAFRTKGCEALDGIWGDTVTHNKDAMRSTEDREAITMLAELLGDDMDGLTATLEDFGLVD